MTSTPLPTAPVPASDAAARCPEHQSSQHGEAAPDAPDWRGFAAAIFATLEARPPTWAFTEVIVPVSARAADADADKAAAVAPAATPEERQAEAESLDATETLDELFARLDGDSASVDRVQAPGPATVSIWRPKVAALLAVLRLAKTFGSAEALARRLAAPGGLALLATGASALDGITAKLIRHLTDEEALWPGGTPGLLAILAGEAVRSGTPEPHRVLGALSEQARMAVEQGLPLVIVTPVASTAPAALHDLRPEILPLAPLDRELLAELLARACPGAAPDAGLLSGLPAGAAVSRLTPDQLTIALRTDEPMGAVRAIAALLAPPAESGPGLAEFPLPAAVRAPLDQLLSDLRAWQAGEIPWRDVSRGLLLAGPPGCGKTEIPRLIAREAGIAVLAGSLGRWTSAGARSSDVIREMRAFFDKAAALAPCVVFIDELDAFGDRARPQDHNSSWTDYVVAGLLECLDGFESHEGVVPMAATNHLDKIDDAIRRPGRFDRVVPLDHPTPELMPQAIRWQLGADLPGADLSAVAVTAAGMSGAAIAAVVRAARGRARAERRPMILDDLAAEIAVREPPLPADLRWRVAVHEAGHAVAGAATGLAVPRLLVIRADGGTTWQVLARGGSQRADIEAGLVVNLAGRTAERLLLGQPSGGAGGPAGSDLASATAAAAALEVSLGLGQSLLWLGTPEDAAMRLRHDPTLRARVESHLRRAETRALALLTANRNLLSEMARALDAAGVLSGAALDVLVAKVVKEGAAGPNPASDGARGTGLPQGGSAAEAVTASGSASEDGAPVLRGLANQAAQHGSAAQPTPDDPEREDFLTRQD